MTAQENRELDELKDSVRAQGKKIESVDEKVEKLSDRIDEGFSKLGESIRNLADKLWTTNEKTNAQALTLAQKGGMGIAAAGGGGIIFAIIEAVKALYK